MRLELAADYLVMAAWLAYLKSARLLPREEQEEPSPEELALRLAHRLARLAAMLPSAPFATHRAAGGWARRPSRWE